MKKFGFTLMEILVGLTIIAVIGILIAPSLSNIMPNSDKIKVLKYHAALEQAIAELLTTEGIYYSVDRNLDGEPDCEGLECTGIPLIAPFREARFEGNFKFENLVSFKLGIENNRYIDGSRWFFVGGLGGAERSIVIIPDGELNNGCTYDVDTCSNPTAYSFLIDNDGNVFGDDALTRAYLETPERTNNKTLDLTRAQEIFAEIAQE